MCTSASPFGRYRPCPPRVPGWCRYVLRFQEGITSNLLGLPSSAALTGFSGSNDTADSSASGGDDRNPAAASKTTLEDRADVHQGAVLQRCNDREQVSARCKKEMTAGNYVTMAETANHNYGALTIKNVKVDQICGDLARVSYGVGVPQLSGRPSRGSVRVGRGIGTRARPRPDRR